MRPRSPEIASARARRANAVRRGDQPAADEALVNLKAARAEQYARELVESWPPLTAEQRMRIAAALLVPVEKTEAAAA